jgi:GntR family transcriptional regulator/MocR family aminotransferase
MLAVRTGLSRAEAPHPDELIITAGAQAGLAAVARTWLGPDRTCAMAPGYPLAGRRAIEATGARSIELDVGDEGRRLGQRRERMDLVVVAPALAGPDGGPLGAAARRRFIDWAARVGAIVVEDDRERDIRADRAPTLGAMDADGRVIGLGSIPADLTPGAALGYLVLPPALHGPVAAMVLAGGQAPGLVDQAALASMLESGDFDRDVRRLREARRAAAAGPAGGPPGHRPRPVGGWSASPGLRLRNRP